MFCAKFRGSELRDLGFRTQKPRQRFGVKSDLIQKRLKYSKKYFTGLLYVLRYPFLPTNPLLAMMSFFFFALFFSF